MELGDGGCALEGGGERCQRAQKGELKLNFSLEQSFEELLQSQPSTQAVSCTVWPQQSLNRVGSVWPLPCNTKTHPWRNSPLPAVSTRHFGVSHTGSDHKGGWTPAQRHLSPPISVSVALCMFTFSCLSWGEFCTSGKCLVWDCRW